MAHSNISFIGFIDEQELAQRYRNARAMVFAAEEDFGMTPVEMQAAGRPMVALGKGGSLETIRFKGGNPTGVAFYELSDDSICQALRSFMDREHEFTVDNCVAHAASFSPARFSNEFQAIAANVLQANEVNQQSSRAAG
jgi:glycosyltransferase involved in cell wall biosynthesis